jgi:hypothetical protein
MDAKNVIAQAFKRDPRGMISPAYNKVDKILRNDRGFEIGHHVYHDRMINGTVYRSSRITITGNTWVVSSRQDKATGEFSPAHVWSDLPL